MQLSHENDEYLETSIWCSNIELIGELSMSSSCGMEREEISIYWKVSEVKMLESKDAETVSINNVFDY